MAFAAYKADQGNWMRRLSGIAALVFALFACVKFYRFAAFTMAKEESFLGLNWAWLQSHMFGVTIVNVDLTPSLVLALALFAYLGYLTWELLASHPRIVDFLVDTEKEMKKVSWPTWEELKGSSTVVVLGVFLLGAYMFVVDWGLNNLMSLMR